MHSNIEQTIIRYQASPHVVTISFPFLAVTLSIILAFHVTLQHNHNDTERTFKCDLSKTYDYVWQPNCSYEKLEREE